MVLPQMPNLAPSKLLWAQRKNPRPMARVFPERTAPSQTMASYSRRRLPGIHQVSTSLCFLENRQ